MKQNWFSTLNDALESEGLVDAWEIHFRAIGYDDTFSWTWQDGSPRGRYISVYRDNRGMYERPIHYRR